MNAADLLASLKGRGIELWFEGERLRFRAPKGALTAELRAALAARRAEVVAQLRTEAAARVEVHPLSFSQRALWFFDQQVPGSAAYNVAVPARVRSPLDVAALRQAAQALVDRHPVLRTTYGLEGDAPSQRVAGDAPVALEINAVPGLDDAALKRRVEADAQRPFDLETGPVLRVQLYTRAAAEHVLVLALHHIAADGWSLLTLFDELLKLYAEAVSGAPAGLPRVETTYADYTRWQAEILAGPEGERLWRHWRDVMAPPRGMPELPTDRPRPAVRSFLGAGAELPIGRGLSETVRALALRERTTPFVVWLAAFHAFLFRLTGADDVTVGTPAFGRSRPEYLPLIGDFVNAVPLRGRLAGSMAFTELVAQLRNTVLEALDAQEFPLSLLVQRLQPGRDSSGSPLFNTFFVLQRFDQYSSYQTLLGGGESDDVVETAGLRLAPYPLQQATTQFDLAVQMVEVEDTIRGALWYATDILDAATVERFAADYVATVASLAERPGMRLDELFLPARAAGQASGIAGLLAQLRSRDIQVAVEGGRLRLNAPKGALDEGLKAALVAQRDALVAALSTPVLDAPAALEHWRRSLAGATAALELPTDRPRPAQPSRRVGQLDRPLDPSLAGALRARAAAQRATLSELLLAAWQALLYRISGQDDLLVAIPAADGAHPARGADATDTLLLRGRFANNPRFAALLDGLCAALSDGFAHRDVSAAALAALLGAEHAADVPLAAAHFALAEDALPAAPAPGYALSLAVAAAPDALQLRYGYSPDLFDAATIARLHGYFATLLAAVAADPAQPVDALPLLGAAERREIAEHWNDTALAHDRGRCVHHLLEASVRAVPDAVAVVADRTLTYRELDARANRLAHLLRARGVRPGDLVAVCLDRTAEIPVALAAVLKLGAAYVPLDPTHPAERLRYILGDAGAACVVTQTAFAGSFGDAAPVVALDSAAADLLAQPAGSPGVTVPPNALAYVIYTSGSTGLPKGVEVEHRNVVAFLEAMRREPGLSAEDTVLAVTTLSFDIAGLEIWLPLSVGARVVIASRADVVAGERLVALLEQHEVSLFQATPASWRLMLDAGWAGRPGLKGLVGGEALPRSLAAALVGRVGALWNMYGPTETTIWSTVAQVTDADAPISIGHPIANTRIYVLDRSGDLAPLGVAGELCIGGEGVARGYRDRPALTAEKFVDFTRPDGAVERIYRTGDVARLLADGRLDYLGRRDFQAKLRGYRIELGEIEAVLATHPGVKECVAVVREDAPGDQRLVGYVTLLPDAAFDAEAARDTLRRRLPDYMVPNLFAVLPALPLTPNNKVDRKALPAPQAAPRPGAANDALMNPAQRRVAAIWRELLHRDRVGLHENFFEAGGHSLLLVRLHAGLKQEFGANIPLVELFQRTTVAAQAERFGAAANGGEALKRAQARAERQVHV